jgi:hypothetical protein
MLEVDLIINGVTEKRAMAGRAEIAINLEHMKDIAFGQVQHVMFAVGKREVVVSVVIKKVVVINHVAGTLTAAVAKDYLREAAIFADVILN